MATKKQRPLPPATPAPEITDHGRVRQPDADDISSVDNLLDEVLGGSEGGEQAPDENANPTPPSGTEPSPDALKQEPAPTPPPQVTRTPKASPTTEPVQAATPATPPAEAPPAAPAQPHDAEIDGIPDPKGMSPNNTENIRKLREVAKKYKGLANQHYSEAEEFKKQIGQIPPEVQKELEENRTFRRMFDITNDTEFKSKFDKPAEDASEEIIGLIKKHGATDEHIKLLKEKGITSLPDKWWEDNVLKPLRESDSTEENTAAAIIKQRLEKVRSLAYERQKAVEHAASTGSEFLKKKDEETKQKEASDLKIMQDRVLEVQTQIPWAQIREVPKDATPEQKAAIEADNKFYKETIEPAFITALNPTTPQAKIETALAACLSFRQHKELTEERATNAQLRAEIARLRGANVIQKPTSTAQTNAPKKGSSVNDHLGKRSEDSLEAAMQDSGL